MSQHDGAAIEPVLAHRRMAILYGTETGNSEEIAEELGEMAERLRFDTVVATMNSLTLVS